LHVYAAMSTYPLCHFTVFVIHVTDIPVRASCP